MTAVPRSSLAHSHMHSEKSTSSLSWNQVPCQPGSRRNRLKSGNSVRPMHLFGLNRDHDYYFELLGEGGAGYPIPVPGRVYLPLWSSAFSRRTAIDSMTMS